MNTDVNNQTDRQKQKTKELNKKKTKCENTLRRARPPRDLRADGQTDEASSRVTSPL